MMVRLDLSNNSMEFMPFVLHQARHSDEERRINALHILATLCDKSSHPETLPSMFHAIKAILGGSQYILNVPYRLFFYHTFTSLDVLQFSTPTRT
jgi:hypothetical protein